jgi:CDP-glycerol glycerophosphotransferase (TagB/SpsB family)
MLLSDALISDTSSIIAEYCALYKPIICIATAQAERTDTEVAEIIDRISLKVKDMDELKSAIVSELAYPAKRIEAQKKAVKIFFDDDKPDKSIKISNLISKFLSSE